MNALAEAEMPVLRAGQVELLGPVELEGIAVGGGPRQDNRLTALEMPATDGDGLGQKPRVLLNRRLIAH